MGLLISLVFAAFVGGIWIDIALDTRRETRASRPFNWEVDGE